MATPIMPWTISPARPEEQAAALELALAHVPAPERPVCVHNALTLLAAGELEADGILVARTGVGLVGALVCVPLKGRGGLCWVPQVDAARAAQDAARLAADLVHAGATWLQSRGACFAQALVAPELASLTGPLAAAGFIYMTDVLYLQHALTELPPLGACPPLVKFSDQSRPLFETTLDATYEGSLDCPELGGLRAVHEVLEGHKAQGLWRPERWRVALVGDVPAGVVLLAELPGGEGWDLSYLGVVPRFRGQGLGRRLTLWALHAAHAGGALQLLTAVDVRNLPALRLYEDLGFRQTGVRQVFLRIFAPRPPDPENALGHVS